MNLAASTTHHGAAPVSDLDPFSDAFRSDPYTHYAALRAAGPAVRLSRLGVWGVARHKEAHAIFNDPATFISGAGAGLQDLRKGKAWRLPSIVLEADPPLHTRTRGVLAKILSGPALRSLREAFKREADALVGRLCAAGRFDAVADFAQAYPLKVVGDAVGVPVEGREILLPYGNMLFNSFGPPNDVFTASAVSAKPIVETLHWQCAREQLAPGSFGAQIYEAADAGQCEADHAPVLVRSLLSAGFDTTVNGLTAAIHAFMQFPEAWTRFRADPSRHKFFFDEAIRWESPAQTFFRTTARACEIGGVEVPADEKVLIFIGSANRDPARWPDPDRFDIDRNPIGHVSFGSGIHVCVGMMLARMEAEMLFAALAEKVTAFEADGEPVRRRNNTLRGFDALPVRVRLG